MNAPRMCVCVCILKKYFLECNKFPSPSPFQNTMDQHTHTHTNLIRTCILKQVCVYFMEQQPLVGQGLLLSRHYYHTQTHHTRQDSSGRVISPSQRPLPDNTQRSQETNIHAPSGIRTRNPSKRAAADPNLRPRVHRDWQD